MVVRNEAVYVRRRRVALLVVVAFVALSVLGVSRLVGVLSGGSAEAAAPRPTPVKAAVSRPGIPVPKPSPVEPQGDPGPSAKTAMVRVLRLTGGLTPKSVVASKQGLVFAQNMMYTHSVVAFRADGARLQSIDDSVDLSEFGVKGHPGTSKGSPVEVAFTPDGRYAWVSNYSMYGKGYGPEGLDTCTKGDGTSPSTVYRIDTRTYAIDKVVAVGSVPKYVAVTPDGKTVLVTNWCSWDLSIIDASSGRETARIPLGGKYPRGVAVSPDSRTAYVALMGSDRVVRVDLRGRAVHAYAQTGDGPRHIVESPDGRYLYVTNNGDGTVSKLERSTGKVLKWVRTGSQPRSMAISPDGAAIYSVNYESSTVTKLRTSDLEVVDEVKTDYHPIGITYEPTRKMVWVACYGGSILVFDDSRLPVA
ncbi:40-residue YVTN family beta-propeller repeat-containing protein [Pedococcus dokdonensis]|uniref:40-residue YVTN family beta-propeller repeat-containing protein n=2 Tax=Pedococcus dokdonensis TaxID=443156 RepID=A0A1H0RZC1_9MICO|nr:40-residue YVTN family beta-propeller repeat-containing protein [Pedococcus dokdonensis]